MVEQVQTGVTLEALQALGEDRWAEVVNGEIREVAMTAGFNHVTIIDNLYDILKPFAKQNHLGMVRTDGLNYLLSMFRSTIRTSRIPDLSFVKRENIPATFDLDGYFPGAPDLAVEVISPHESESDLDEKISDYFTAGTEQVWAVYPRAQLIHVYLREENLTAKTRTYHLYRSGDMLEGPTLFPGLQIEVAAVFAQEF
jgi:Uma2 family endonuclease